MRFSSVPPGRWEFVVYFCRYFRGSQGQTWRTQHYQVDSMNDSLEYVVSRFSKSLFRTNSYFDLRQHEYGQ